MGQTLVSMGWVALGLQMALAVAAVVASLALVLNGRRGRLSWALLLVAANFPWGFLLGWPQAWIVGRLSGQSLSVELEARSIQFLFGLLGNAPLFVGLALGLTEAWRQPRRG